MLLIPIFQIGLWNAWLGTIILIIASSFPAVIKSKL